MNEEMLQKLKESYMDIKNIGIVTSIIMIILGIVIFFVPVSAVVVTMWIMVIGLLIAGIMDIVVFCNMPKGARDGWKLALGIIWILIAGIFVLGQFSSTFAERLFVYGNFGLLIAFMIGFSSLFNGIQELCSYSEVKAMNGSGSACIVSGILGILLGLIVLSYPIGSLITLTICYGLFLIIGGIALLCRTLSY